MIIMLLYENKYFVEEIEIRKNMLKDLTVSLNRLGLNRESSRACHLKTGEGTEYIKINNLNPDGSSCG